MLLLRFIRSFAYILRNSNPELCYACTGMRRNNESEGCVTPGGAVPCAFPHPDESQGGSKIRHPGL